MSELTLIWLRQVMSPSNLGGLPTAESLAARCNLLVMRFLGDNQTSESEAQIDVLALHLEANLSEVTIRLLVTEGVDNPFERETTVDNWAHTVEVDGSDHVLLMRPISN